jgi:hypothetical protein
MHIGLVFQNFGILFERSALVGVPILSRIICPENYHNRHSNLSYHFTLTTDSAINISAMGYLYDSSSIPGSRSELPVTLDCHGNKIYYLTTLYTTKLYK